MRRLDTFNETLLTKVVASEVSILTDLNYLDDVFALYRKDSATLGFMPEGAFRQAISNRRLLVAKDGDKIVGYLFFRIARGRAAVVHLCVTPAERGRGFARMLVQTLKENTTHLECVTLRCRGDFPANGLWPKLGFHPKARVKGRGSEGAELTIWHFDHGHEDLFSSLVSEKTLVVIDTNIFLDLSFPERPHHSASMGLTDAWLDEIIADDARIGCAL